MSVRQPLRAEAPARPLPPVRGCGPLGVPALQSGGAPGLAERGGNPFGSRQRMAQT